MDLRDVLDKLIEEMAEHKIGDIISVDYVLGNNEWEVTDYMIGGYRLKNIYTGEVSKAETEYVKHTILDLNKIAFHEGHEVIATFVTHPDRDSYLYCKKCKREVFTRYKYEKASISKYSK